MNVAYLISNKFSVNSISNKAFSDVFTVCFANQPTDFLPILYKVLIFSISGQLHAVYSFVGQNDVCFSSGGQLEAHPGNFVSAVVALRKGKNLIKGLRRAYPSNRNGMIEWCGVLSR